MTYPEPIDIVAAGSAELRQQLRMPHSLLTERTAETLVHVLWQAEDDIYRLGPRRYPALIAFGLVGRPSDDGGVQAISVDYIDLAERRWAGGLDSADAVAIAQEWIASAPEHPTMAWAVAGNGTIKNSESEEKKDAHILCAADIDGRMYSYSRQLDNGQRRLATTIADGWARLLRGELDTGDPEATAILDADGLHKPHQLAAHLMVVTRLEMEALLADVDEKHENPADG